MDVRRAKFVLRLASAAMLAAGLGGAVVAVRIPFDDQMPKGATASTRPTTAASTEIDLSPLFDVSLPRPVAATPPTPPSTLPAISPAPTTAARLVGTIIESDHRFAVFTTPAGGSEIKTLGDSELGSPVIAINPDSATLLVDGKPVELHVVRPATSTPGR